MTAATVRFLFASHILAFVAGFAVGKLVDRDELETYRSLHETTGVARFRRFAEKVALGMLAVGTLVVVVRVTRTRQQ
jgi:hypothetical protein